MAMGLHFGLVLVCFALSGFAALLYETAWVRQFAFVFGTSDLAVATVLAAYFGGLTAGAAVAGRLAHRINRPVLVYGLLELGIALAALAVPTALHACTRVHVLMLGLQDAPPAAAGFSTALFYLACAFLILMAPTAMMGATLPLLAKHVVRRDQELGSRVGWLYAINTVGAAGGTLCAAFVLLPAIGLSRTVWVGVAVNALVFAVAATISIRDARRTAPPALPPAPVTKPGRFGLVLPLIMLSGVASFSYEVIWTRLLAQILGASVYAFATMLASFLLGITLGAAIATRLASSPRRSARAFGWAQIGVGGLSLAAFAAIDRLPAFAKVLSAGATGNLGANSLLAMAMLVPGALCMGAAFPLAVRVLARGEFDAGPVSARVYAWNTVGAIVGAIGTGFFVLPWLGFATTLWAVVSLNLLIAALACFLVSPALYRTTVAAVTCGVILAVVRPAEPWGVLRYSPNAGQANMDDSIAYYGVGRNATVLMLDDGLRWQLRTGGLPEATISRTASVGPLFQVVQWLSGLPVLARPDARQMLMVGLGGGNAVSAVPSSIASIDVIELEPEVIEANRAIATQRHTDPLADPRVQLIVNDARGSLLLTRKKYDAIVSQPSHPWTSGSAHLYSREFFELIRDHLVHDGVFVQWIGLPFVDEALLKSLVGTLCDVFPHVRVYQPVLMEVLFVASGQPLPIEESCAQAIARSAAEFAACGIVASEDLAAALVLDEMGAKRFSAGAALITDDHNLLQMHSLKALRDYLVKQEPPRYFAEFDPGFPETLDLNHLYIVHRHLRLGFTSRALRHAQSISNSAQKAIASGYCLAAVGKQQDAIRTFRQVLTRYPGHAAARFALLRSNRFSVTAENAQAMSLINAASDPHLAVFEGWMLQAAADWTAMRELDERLAKAAPLDDCFAEAARLRAIWRVRADDVDLAAEARPLIDHLIARFAQPADFLLRAEAAAVSGDVVDVLTSLTDALNRTTQGTGSRAAANMAAAVLSRVPQDPAYADARTRVRSRIDAILQGKSDPRGKPKTPMPTSRSLKASR